MKCPICDGGGRITSLPSGMPVKCTRCNGTGEVEQTNEEWLDRKSTKEKAEEKPQKMGAMKCKKQQKNVPIMSG